MATVIATASGVMLLDMLFSSSGHAQRPSPRLTGACRQTRPDPATAHAAPVQVQAMS
jgi:hypothetical protein